SSGIVEVILHAVEARRAETVRHAGGEIHDVPVRAALVFVATRDQLKRKGWAQGRKPLFHVVTPLLLGCGLTVAEVADGEEEGDARMVERRQAGVGTVGAQIAGCPDGKRAG